MATRIFKYDLAITDRQTLQLPAGAELLSVREQHAEVYADRNTPASLRTLQLWALVDDQAPMEPRAIAIIGTGNPMPDVAGVFIDSVVMARGALVWHIFEVTSYGND